MVDVVCMGELLMDFVSTERNVSIGESAAFVRAPGGAPANVAVAAARLGLGARFVGKVGDDPFGEHLRDVLSREGVDTTFLFTDRSARTTAVFVGVWDDGRKDLCFYRNPGADMLITPEEITPEIFAGARAFHYGSITLIDEPGASAQRKAMALAAEAGLMISYDPNYRSTLWPDEAAARETIMEGFAHCHLAKVSGEEWQVATGAGTVDAGIDAVLARGVELIVVSLGAEGAVATNGDWRVSAPAFEVECVEVTGAGDGFLAAMISRLLPERERAGTLAAVEKGVVEEALVYANAVGALACSRHGAIPALPRREAVAEFLTGRGRKTGG